MSNRKFGLGAAGGPRTRRRFVPLLILAAGLLVGGCDRDRSSQTLPGTSYRDFTHEVCLDPAAPFPQLAMETEEISLFTDNFLTIEAVQGDLWFEVGYQGTWAQFDPAVDRWSRQMIGPVNPVSIKIRAWANSYGTDFYFEAHTTVETANVPLFKEVLNTYTIECSNPPVGPELIAFASLDRDGGTDLEIFVVEVGDQFGTTLEQLTDNDWDDKDPVWSRDGTQIAFLSDEPDPGSGSFDLYLMDADGSNRERLLYYAEDGINVSDPAWSPVVDKIAVAVHGAGIGMIMVHDVATGTTNEPTQGFTGEFSPTWSPDGTKLAFTRNGALYTVDSDATGPSPSEAVLLDDPATIDYAPAWSPDGGSILFVRDGGDLFEIDPVSKSVTSALIGGSAGAPCWSPGGTHISFTQYAQLGILKVCVMVAGDPASIREISGQPVDLNEDPDWGP